MNWRVFIIAFSILFFAELGDKTQLAVFTLVSQYREPLPIFLGASSGLVLVTLIAALFGEVVSQYIPQNYMQLAAGILFILIGIFILKDALPPFIRYWTYF